MSKYNFKIIFHVNITVWSLLSKIKYVSYECEGAYVDRKNTPAETIE